VKSFLALIPPRWSAAAFAADEVSVRLRDTSRFVGQPFNFICGSAACPRFQPRDWRGRRPLRSG